MANDNLTGQTIASTYNQLLVTADTGGITGSGTNATQIHCGAATAGAGNADTTALYLSTTRVGIGTATPDYLLDVEGAGSQSIRVYSTDDNAAVHIASHTNESQDSSIGDNAVQAMTIKGDGNVGIGAVAPVRALDIQASSWQLRIGNDATYFYDMGVGGTGNMTWSDKDGNTRMVLEASGNVGIGTATPGRYQRWDSMRY